MSISIQRHTLDTLSDDTQPGGCPQDPVSTWAFDQVGYIEATGEYAALIEHNRDLAKGLLDPAAGFLSGAEVDDERSDEDAMRIARQGGERVYEQEQGFAPLVLLPGLLRDGSPNADAYMAAWLEDQHPATSLTTPDLPMRRHWGDVDLGEQLEGISPMDAETQPVEEFDAMLLAVNDRQAFADGAIRPTYGTDGVDFSQMHEDAPDLAEHFEAMLDQQAEALLREYRHARECEAAHNLVESSQGVRRRRRSDADWMAVTQPWREQNQRRKAALAERAGYMELRAFDGAMPAVPAPRELVEPDRATWVVIPAGSIRQDEDGDHRTTEDLVVPVAPIDFRPGPSAELPHISDERWWRQHGARILIQVAEWHPTLEPGTDAWWDAAEDAYYVLKHAA